jgi:hypothetical protein
MLLSAYSDMMRDGDFRAQVIKTSENTLNIEV